MIRKFETKDMNQVLDIWLKASIEAHSFISKSFWESKVDDMRQVYIPASETYIYEEDGVLKGFFSLYNDVLAAIFVLPEFQGNGIGKQLIGKVKELREKISLTVYKENTSSIEFYKKCGFVIEKEQKDKHTGHIELVMKI